MTVGIHLHADLELVQRELARRQQGLQLGLRHGGLHGRHGD